jgi:antitoxin component YwqK of YwqJK toxin-antitoxin module
MMKISNLILVILVLTISVQAQEKSNQVDAKNLKQGPWKKYYENGKLKYAGQFKDDKPSGLFLYYFESGVKKAEVLFSNNGAYSRAKNFYPTGKLSSEGLYINEKKDSIWKFYDLSGVLQIEEMYRNGLKEGISKIYYDNQQISSLVSYLDDKRNGPNTEYFQNGKVKLKANYVNDELEGEYEINYPNELPYKKGKYVKSIPVGWWGIYNPEGELQVREFYQNGQRTKIEYNNGKFEDVYPSQIPKELVTYKNGKKNGPFIEYFDTGTWKKEERINEQSGEKETYQFLEGQVPKRKGNYMDDKLDGEVIYFDEKGKIKKKENYKLGELAK